MHPATAVLRGVESRPDPGPPKPGARSGPGAVAAATLAVLVSALTPAGARPAPSGSLSPTRLSAPLVLTQVPARPPLPASLSGGLLRGDLERGGRLVLVHPDGKTAILSDGFAAAADPEVSYDGKRILFSGRKSPGDPWCLYEMESDGTGVHRVTCGPGSARHGIYLPPLFTITPTSTETWLLVAFVGSRPGEVNEAGTGEAESLYACRLDGSALRRLTFNLSSDTDPAVLPDGRLVYASWQLATLEHGERGRFELLAANTDGTDYVPFSTREGFRVKQMPAVTRRGLVVFVEAESLEAEGAGRLASVSLRRPLHSHRVLTRKQEGRYYAPSPLPGGEVLVSSRPWKGGGDHAVYRLDPATGRRKEVFDAPGWHDVQAKLLAPRPLPDRRSSPVRGEEETGVLFALDVGIGDLPEGALPRGAARRLRVVEGLPRRGEGTPASPLAARRILGEAPVDDDGSFHVVVPAHIPLQLQILDEDGLALRSSAWVWVQNHFNQGCVGCHEDPERAPPNRFVEAVAAPPAVLTLPPGQRRAVDYRHDLAPLVEARCVPCHGVNGRQPDLRPDPGSGEDSPGRAYRELMEKYVQPGRARTSRLIWHLFNRNTSRPWDKERTFEEIQPMPGGEPTLSDEERLRFVEWIDLGAAWDAERAADPAARSGAAGTASTAPAAVAGRSGRAERAKR